jgi:hypothetical protein
MASDYTFGIFKTFLLQRNKNFKMGQLQVCLLLKSLFSNGTFGQFLAHLAIGQVSFCHG